MITRGNRRRRNMKDWGRDLVASMRSFAVSVYKVVLAVLVLAVLATGGFYGVKLFNESRRFVLADVNVYGNVTLTQGEVLDDCNLWPGATDLLFADSEEFENRAVADPRLRTVKVIIDPPRSADIIVEEHDCVAYLVADDGLWAINHFGEVWDKADPGDMWPKPLIVLDKTPKSGLVVPRPVIQEALRLIRSVNRGQNPWKDTVIVVGYDEYLGLTLAGLDDGPVVRFGFGQYPRKIKVLGKALVEVEKQGFGVREIMLDDSVNPNRVAFKPYEPRPVETAVEEVADLTGIEGDEMEMYVTEEKFSDEDMEAVQ